MAAPKGVRSRSTPDWFSYYMSTAGTFAQVIATTHFLYTSLYNDSSQGYYLHVFGLMPVDDINTVALAYLTQGTVGNQGPAASRINPMLPSPPGVTFTFDNGAAAIAATPTTVLAVAFAGATVQDVPLFVIPPTYSLVIGGVQATNLAGCGFWFIPMLDVRGVQAV